MYEMMKAHESRSMDILQSNGKFTSKDPLFLCKFSDLKARAHLKNDNVYTD